MEVCDTGVGIDSDKIGMLFKPFSSASEDHHRTFGGTGLGLWISKVIVQVMGGSIQCTSELGKGSTFSLQIPVQYYRTTPNTPKLTPMPVNRGYRKNTIDASSFLSSQKYHIVLVSKNKEDVMLLKSSLMALRSSDIEEKASIHEVDFE